jgi:hypothetical protein
MRNLCPQRDEHRCKLEDHFSQPVSLRVCPASIVGHTDISRSGEHALKRDGAQRGSFLIPSASRRVIDLDAVENKPSLGFHLKPAARAGI